MKKVYFYNKEMKTESLIMVGQVGEKVFAVCNNVKETNDAVKWCNTHKTGDKFDCDLYTMEIA